jgi:hypothetical protein
MIDDNYQSNKNRWMKFSKINSYPFGESEAGTIFVSIPPTANIAD